MSEIDAKIRAVLDRFDQDIERVTEKLDPILQSGSIDELSEAAIDDKQTAVPYALSAYALSSMLFAYLRSEGKDTAIVMPELARVKEQLEKLNAPSRQGSEPPSDSGKARTSGHPEKPSGNTSKSTGKHMRFDDVNSTTTKAKKRPSARD